MQNITIIFHCIYGEISGGVKRFKVKLYEKVTEKCMKCGGERYAQGNDCG